jgi:alanine dehydrogenase
MPRLKEVKVFDVLVSSSVEYATEMGSQLRLSVYPMNTIEEALDADVIVTTTPSMEPIIMKHFVKPGTHINAIEADARGKQELETDLIETAKIIVDDIQQASHSGEVNVPLSQGKIRMEDIYGNLGEIVAGKKLGRETNHEITIFDSTGLSTQDIICAGHVYEKMKRGEGLTSQ